MIAEVLLKRAKHKLTRFPSVPRATDIDDGAQKLCVNQKLTVIEHVPPMRIAMLRKRLTLVRHVSERDLAARKEIFQVCVLSFLPFNQRRIKRPSISDRSKESSAVLRSLRVTLRAVTLNRKSRDGS